MIKQTPLFNAHIQAGARMVDFGGWNMPINYGSQIEEHHAVRNDAGMFDVSHMTIVDINGEHAKHYLQKLLANDVAKLNKSGKALYTAMLNQKGGVIDDLIVYYLNDQHYRLVVNAATREKDLAWMQQQARDFSVTVTENNQLAIIAVQGPNAIAKTHDILSPAQQQAVADLAVFSAVQTDDLFIARTGYTGENGYEIMLPAAQAENFWQQLITAGVAPCGLGARDTLRLEAGMNLYGNEMDENISPLQANMSWTIAWEPESRDFIGKQALLAEKAAGVKHKLVGLLLQGKGIIRAQMPVIIEDIGKGKTTSGSLSPSLQKSIGLARVPQATALGQTVMLEIRGKQIPAQIVKPCFVRNGKFLV